MGGASALSLLEKAMEARYHIVGHALCPYVQRVVILMLEKNIQFRRTDIELHDKPEWLSRLSPTGKVPVLVVDDIALFESQVICEYLDENSPGSLYPRSSLKRAVHRAWIVFAGGILDNIACAIYADKTAEAFMARAGKIRAQLRQLESRLGEQSYFDGDVFMLVDAVYATVFRYFPMLSHVLADPIENGLTKIAHWHRVLSARESVRRAVPDDYPARLAAFVNTKNSYLASQTAR